MGLQFGDADSIAKRDEARPKKSKYGEVGVKRFEYMHKKHGFWPGEVCCRECVYLVRYGGNTASYLKCQKYGISNSEATDWRAKWEACGLFEPRVN